MATDDAVRREVAWTTWAESCKDPAVTPEGDLRQCRRRSGHKGDCASGFGAALRRWTK